MNDNHPALERFVDSAGQLYTLPTVAVEILRLTSQPKVDLAALKSTLERDPALVGKVLRVVNSSLFGLSREVCDLGQALALLGTKSIRLLVLGFSLPDELFSGVAGEILNRYWHHTTAKAAAAREISETVYRIPGEEAFIAGLLQDIGILVLLQQLGEPYVRFLDRALAKEVDVDGAEAVALGFEHVQLSARLLERWGLPASLVRAIGVGNSTDRMAQLPATERALPEILHLAELLAATLTTKRADCLSELLDTARQYRHQITSAQLTSLVCALQTKVQQLSEVLAFELPAELDYQQIYADAQRQLAAAAEQAVLALGPTRLIHVEADALEMGVLSASASLAEAAQSFVQTKSHHATRTLAPAKPVSIGAQAETNRSDASAIEVDSPPPSTHESISPDSPATDFPRRVTLAVATCRQTRCPLSLIFVEIDRLKELTVKKGRSEANRFSELLGLLCARTEHPQATSIKLRDGCYALLLSNCDRPIAGALGHRLLTEVRRLCQRHTDLAEARLTISVGIATTAMPAKNFSAHSLIESAQRCLHTAHLSGGNTAKSIDVL
jgi:HD-like signal output (HDOD) protein/GGDEF domain-containing protein